MKKVFNENILKYIGEHMEKSHMRTYHNVVPIDTFEEIILEWISFYEKNIDQIVSNTFKIIDLMNGECGYSAITQRWLGKNRITVEQLSKCYLDNFVASICHLYQKWDSKYQREERGGATGLMTAVSWSLSFHDSDYKSVKKIAVTDFWIGLNIGASLHSEIDIHN